MSTLPALPRQLGRVTAARRVAGGDLNEAWAVDLAGGARAFVKTRAGAPAGEYAAEAAGLRWLGEAGALRVPRVLSAGDDHLALEWIEPGALSPAGADGRPWLIDPAAYGGHREVDLAMLRLFGAPDPRALAAYAEAYPLAAGHDERVALWQLLPLLVHAVLFGGGYGASAERAARRYD